jgi:hypothetical protein
VEKISKSKNLEAKEYVKAAFELQIKILGNPLTKLRMSIIDIISCFVGIKGVMKESEVEKFDYIVW